LPALLAGVHEALLKLAMPAPSAPEVADKPTPAQVRKSITPDALISFIDGKPYKTLKRHLSRNGLTIEQYRERYGLPRDYPSTAASYSAQRSELARSLGLGQQRRKSSGSAAAEAPAAASEPADKPKRAPRGRKVKESA
jgi:predicted transcriptional regulator